MELTPNQLSHLMKRFPEFELSYETISNNKVSQDYQIALAIPVGKKFFAWFTFHQNKDVCYIFEINREKKITKGKCYTMESLPIPKLSLGTLLYGTIPDTIQTEQSPFIIEDIFYYQGVPLKKEPFGNKMEFLFYFMETISGSLIIKNPAFILPVIWELKHPLMIDEPPILPLNIGYQTHHVQYRTTTIVMPYLNVFLNNPKKNNNNKISTKLETTNIFTEMPLYKPDFNKPQYKFKTIFQVQADIQFDIYHLFAFGKKQETIYYNVAYIPNYNSSVFMNGLFRKIRENKNLDYIEESDDEEDFQNTNIDKYVNLEKKLYMECVFHPKFKKWIPIKVVDKNSKVVHINKLVRGYDFY